MRSIYLHWYLTLFEVVIAFAEWFAAATAAQVKSPVIHTVVAAVYCLIFFDFSQVKIWKENLFAGFFDRVVFTVICFKRQCAAYAIAI